MKNAIWVSILTTVLVVGAAAVYAGPPVSGTYKSTNGDFDEGTATTSWAPGGYLATGNILYGRSYAGGSFTNDWIIGCPVVSAVTTILPLFGSTGNAIYKIDYVGGYVSLGGPGNPWNGGDAVYTGLIDTYVEIRTVQYVSNKIVGAVSDHSVSAHIQGYNESCVAWAIGNGVLRGSLPALSTSIPAVKPANYPNYPQADCTLSPTGTGHWDDIRDLTLTVQGCAVATERSTWGNVKAMYRD